MMNKFEKKALAKRVYKLLIKKAVYPGGQSRIPGTNSPIHSSLDAYYKSKNQSTNGSRVRTPVTNGPIYSSLDSYYKNKNSQIPQVNQGVDQWPTTVSPSNPERVTNVQPVGTPATRQPSTSGVNYRDSQLGTGAVGRHQYRLQESTPRPNSNWQLRPDVNYL